ncbi:MAG: hypothetical protein Q8L74_09955 [Nitrospirota bacterium]|nr:hypothetical protein [Nitrospirota bacterium]
MTIMAVAVIFVSPSSAGEALTGGHVLMYGKEQKKKKIEEL